MVVQLNDDTDTSTTTKPRPYRNTNSQYDPNYVDNSVQQTPPQNVVPPDAPVPSTGLTKEQIKEQIKLEDAKFANRRRMAYISLFSIIIFTCLIMFYITPEKIKAMEVIFTYLYITLGSVVGFYMGATGYVQAMGMKYGNYNNRNN